MEWYLHVDQTGSPSSDVFPFWDSSKLRIRVLGTTTTNQRIMANTNLLGTSILLDMPPEYGSTPTQTPLPKILRLFSCVEQAYLLFRQLVFKKSRLSPCLCHIRNVLIVGNGQPRPCHGRLLPAEARKDFQNHDVKIALLCDRKLTLDE
jgi:hypothetical protein